MASFKNLTAPTTNQKAANRLADTQAIRARSLVTQAQPGANITQIAQQAAPQLTAQTGQAALQEQAQQAGLAKQQAQLSLNQQRMGQSDVLFKQQMDLAKNKQKLDKTLNDINIQAANKERSLRNAYVNNKSQQSFLNQQQLADWAVMKSESTDQFKDRVQKIEQAHAKHSMMIDHSYKLILQQKQQEANKASTKRKQQLEKELAQIKRAWEAEQARRKARAANRSAMYSAGGTVVGLGVATAVAATVLTGGLAAPAAPAIIAAGAAGGGAVGTMGASQNWFG